jgi:hypothetical protein
MLVVVFITVPALRSFMSGLLANLTGRLVLPSLLGGTISTSATIIAASSATSATTTGAATTA